MARPPNYRHERSERERAKVAKAAAKAAAKALARATDQAILQTPGGQTDEP